MHRAASIVYYRDMRDMIANHSRVVALSILPIFMTAFPTALAAPAYTFSAFNVPGAIGTIPIGMNDKGQVVGFYDEPSGGQPSFLKDGDVITTINALGTGLARGIDNYGRIVGSAGADGYVLDGDRVTLFRPPNSTNTETQKISDSGVIVGGYTEQGVGVHGFVKIESAYQIIDVPFAAVGNTLAVTDLNDAGDMVGIYFSATRGLGGFLKVGDDYTDLNFPGSSFTIGRGINNAGQIVGAYGLGGKVHGFLKEGDVYTTVDFLSAYTEVFDINNAGQIVGTSFEQPFVFPQVGFIGTPVPEPSAFAILSAVGFSVLRRRCG